MDALLLRIIDAIGLTREQQRFIVRAMWVTLVSIHILWVCGWLAFFGVVSPFASATSLDQISSDLRGDRIERLETEILAVRKEQCHADTPEIRSQYSERLQELVTKYESIARKEPRIPACDEV